MYGRLPLCMADFTIWQQHLGQKNSRTKTNVAVALVIQIEHMEQMQNIAYQNLTMSEKIKRSTWFLQAPRHMRSFALQKLDEMEESEQFPFSSMMQESPPVN